MAKRNSTRSAPADLQAILGRFLDGLAVILVTQRSLEEQEIAGDEIASLRTAISMLNAVYNELDAVERAR